MNQTNPYQSSAVNPSLQASHSSGGRDLVASPHAIHKLLSSKGWVRFMSVMIFVYLAFVSLIGLFSLSFLGSGRAGLGAIVIFVVLLVASVSLMLGLRLSAYASAMSRLKLSNHHFDLEAAMVAQGKFWGLAGILSVIYLVIAVFQVITLL